MTDLGSYSFSRKESAVLYLCIVLLGIVLSLLFYRNIIFSVVIIPFSGKIIEYVRNTMIEKRRADYLIQFKDFLFMASTAIGAGRSMKDAIAESIPGLSEIYGDKAILICDLREVYERLQNGGENDVDVLMDMAISVKLEDVMDFVSIYSICKSTGASMIIALNKAAGVIIDKMTIEKEIKELVRRKEVEGLIIFIMPIIVILFLNLCAPDYIAPLYESVAGRIIMTVTIAVEIGIYGVIQKIIHVEI